MLFMLWYAYDSTCLALLLHLLKQDKVCTKLIKLCARSITCAQPEQAVCKLNVVCTKLSN